MRRLSGPSHVLFAVLFLLASPGLAAAEGKWDPWVEFGGYGANEDRSRGEANVFMPIWQDADSLFYFQGKGKFFGGTIRRAHLDGSCDIDYDDGDREQGVRPEDIQAEDTGPPPRRDDYDDLATINGGARHLFLPAPGSSGNRERLFDACFGL